MMATRSTEALDRRNRPSRGPLDDSPNPSTHPLVPEAIVGKRRAWTAWQDWANIGLGALLALSQLWLTGAPTGLFLTLGILAVAVALWAGSTGSSTLAEVIQILIGGATIASPLFAEPGAVLGVIWMAWIVGGGLIVNAAMAMHQNRSGRSEHNEHDVAQRALAYS